jgi:ArsR family transcriptional regulator, arsenate/arsenite/antimonite-responsive transcriptional repressor
MASSPSVSDDTRTSRAACAGDVALDAVDTPDDETLAQLAKALGHPARIRILRLLASRETCITGDVVAELPLAQSTVSEHLRILKEAGIVEATPVGTRSAYCISATGLALLKRGVAEL